LQTVRSALNVHDACDYAHSIELFARRLVDVFALSDSEHELTVLSGLFDSTQRGSATYRNRHRDAGEHDGPAQWHDWKCLTL
jgi:hypothetical protein